MKTMTITSGFKSRFTFAFFLLCTLIQLPVSPSCGDEPIKESAFAKSLVPGKFILPPKDGWWNWGMAPIYDEQGQLHIFNSSIPFKGEKGMGFWQSKSVINHYVADSIEGPYQLIGTAFSSDQRTYHNPQISKVGDTYVIVFLWKSVEKGSLQSIGMATAKSLNGPWTENPNNPIIRPTPGTPNSTHASNPTFLIDREGKFRIYYKSMSKGSKFREISVAIAENLDGPYVDSPNNPLISFKEMERDIEDPYAFFYRDTYYMIVEDRMDVAGALSGKPSVDAKPGGNRPGLLFTSKDGIKWSRPQHSYNTVDHYFDKELSRSERPHILWKDGKPAYLFLANHEHDHAGFYLKIENWKGDEVATLSSTQSSAKAVQLKPDDVTAIIASRGELTGNAKKHFRSANVVHGFSSPQDTVTWTVNVPKEDDYVVDVLFSKEEHTQLEVSSGDSVLTAPSMVRTWEYRPFFWRQELPGTLHLKAGENKITFRLPEAKPEPAAEGSASEKPLRFGQGVTKEFHLFSIELGTAAARKARVERAQAIRGDASWMVDGKYGIFVHWSSQSRGFNIAEKRADWFQKSVEMFDVDVFADAIERTGASWIVFTATHQGFYWPGPNAAIDKVAPGRTAERDLLGEIINELDSRGIRTLFYLHTGYNGYDPEVWREAVGANEPDGKRFSDNIEAILRECSLRYGEKLKGFGYMDGALAWDYPLNPSWEGWARAIKAGNPKAVVGLSSNRGTTVSPFNELAVTDGASELLSVDPQLIGPGQQLGDVTNAWWCLMDKGGWFQKDPMNGQYTGGATHSTEEYVAFFKRMAEAKIPVTINLILTADVTDDHPIFNPKCMEVMDEVRKAIRGK